jgi:hypothetical protein
VDAEDFHDRLYRMKFALFLDANGGDETKVDLTLGATVEDEAMFHVTDGRALTFAKPAAAVDGLTEAQKVERDAYLYGTGFMRDGKHIPAQEVMVSCRHDWATDGMGDYCRYCKKREDAYDPPAAAVESEPVATVCLRGERYGHDNFIEVQLQKAPGVDFPIGTKFSLHPPADSAVVTDANVLRKLRNARNDARGLRILLDKVTADRGKLLADSAGVTEAQVEAALDALDEACKNDSGKRVSWVGHTRADRLSIIRAALSAARGK